MNSQKEKEFESYYLKYYQQVYGYILKKVYGEQIAEDLTMDVFYSVCNKFETFDESKASFQTWLYVIVNNRLKNYYRDRKEFVELDDNYASEVDEGDDVINAIHLQNLRDHLYKALEETNEIQRKIVILKYFNDMNASDISRYTGLSAGNVRIQLKRALDKIRYYFYKNNIRWE